MDDWSSVASDGWGGNGWGSVASDNWSSVASDDWSSVASDGWSSVTSDGWSSVASESWGNGWSGICSSVRSYWKSSSAKAEWVVDEFLGSYVFFSRAGSERAGQGNDNANFVKTHF